MNIRITSLVLCLGLHAATAAPRGSGVRGEAAARRKLQQMGGMDKNDKDGAVGANGVSDEDREEGPAVLVVETHACADAQVAIDYVGAFGHPDQGDVDCYLDPENACNGGCCRYAQWFICDEDDAAPSMPCVCNQNTAAVIIPDPVPDPLDPVVTDPIDPVDDPVDAIAGNATDTAESVNSTGTLPSTDASGTLPIADAPSVTPPLTQEMLEEEFPDIAALLSAQEQAPRPPGMEQAEVDGDGGGFETDDWEDDKWAEKEEDRNMDINFFD